MQLVKEFWTGAIVAFACGLASFGLAAALGWRGGDAITHWGLAAAGLGFVLGATGAELRSTGVRSWARQFFGIDLRSLALLRMGIAISILVDLALRARDLQAHYSDAGILPRSVFDDPSLAALYRPSWFSVHALSGSTWFQGLLFCIAAVIALFLLAGCYTRTATVLSWLLLVSLHNRNALIGTGGDDLLRLLLFWGMFLPLGARYSVDSALNMSLSKRRTQIANAASFALLVQLACMYFFSGVYKDHAQWQTDGTAVYYTLSLDMLTTSLGQYLLNYPMLLRSLTFFVLLLEIGSPAIIFMPWRNSAFRYAFLVLFGGLHLGFWLCMWIGIFPFVGMVALTSLIPNSLWERLSKRSSSRRETLPTIYIDGSSGFCRRVALLSRTFLLLPNARIRQVRSRTGSAIQAAMQKKTSWVVVDGPHQKTAYDAFLCLCSRSALCWPLARVGGWRPLAAIGNRLHHFWARRRATADRCTRCLRLHRNPIKTFWPVQPLVLAFLLFVVAYNVSKISGWQTDWLRNTSSVQVFGKAIRLYPQKIYATGRLLRLDQNWKLFAPYPLMEDGWFVTRAKVVKGGTLDVRTGGDVTFEKPASVAWTYPNNRWRKYMELLRTRGGHVRLQEEYCRYLCQRWNAAHDDREDVEWMDLYFVLEFSRPPDTPLDQIPRFLLRYRCPDGQMKKGAAPLERMKTPVNN